MRQVPKLEALDIYVWEGATDIVQRVVRALACCDVDVRRADGMSIGAPRDSERAAIAIVSTSVLDGGAGALHDWDAADALPVIWVGAAPDALDACRFPAGYPCDGERDGARDGGAHVLPLDFSAAQLRAMLCKLAPQPARRDDVRAAEALIARAPCMQALLREVDTFADCDSSVLLHGETGVGKERIARLLHDKHLRNGRGPFVPVNCGAIPDGLFESLLFGHAKGAFTGAVLAHKGYFEQAHGGTLFLDEIGDLPLYQQVKLLRVLEDRTVTRIGSATPVSVDFRLIAASNKSLPQLVKAGKFRADLYYRLAVIEIGIPTLEERGAADKIALFNAFIGEAVGGERLATLPAMPEWLTSAVARLSFPGNVRELRNLAERVGVTARQLGSWDRTRIERLLALARHAQPADAVTDLPIDRRKWDMNERNRVIAALHANGWRRQDTAQALGISRKVLWEKMRKFQIFDEEPAHAGRVA